MTDLLTSPLVEPLRSERLSYAQLFPAHLPIDSLEDEDWMECDLPRFIEP